MIALDLFAGTGWGVACQWLGIEENGVEIMPEAVATRSANGMKTIYNDVWDGLSGKTEPGGHDILIASPPCQTFSVAGSGSGRAALDDVIGLIDEKAYQLEGDGLRARASALGMDDRTALILTPLAYAYRHRPRFIALEKVPTVLPVWKRIAGELKSWGYSVEVGNLQAEQYFVPQTRRRAFLVASRDGVATLPDPGCQKYDARSGRLADSDWVSASQVMDRTDLPTWTKNRPSTTVTSSNLISGPGTRDYGPGGVSRQDAPGTFKASVGDKALLQGYPADFIWVGSNTKAHLQIGNAVPPPLASAVLQTFIDQDGESS